MTLTHRPLLLCLAAGLVSCEAGPVRKEPEPLPRRASETQRDLLKRIDVLFVVGGGEELDQILTETAAQAEADPVAAKAVTMILLFHMIDAEKVQRRAQQNQFQLRSLEQNERWVLARRSLRLMGPAVVPTVRAELIENRHGDNRRAGVTVLAAMDPEVVPEVKAAFEASEERYRRHYVDAVAAMRPSSAAELQLLAWARHSEYDVRTPALRGLARYGTRHLPLLRDAVAKDSDVFVRRQVVEALAPFKDRLTAATVVEYYADCARRGDDRGVRTAERTLVKMSGLRASRGKQLTNYGLAFWKKWVMSLPAGQEQR